MPAAFIKNIPNLHFHSLYLLKAKINALFHVQVSELNNNDKYFTLHLQATDPQKSDICKAIDFVKAQIQPQVRQNFQYHLEANAIFGAPFWTECLERRYGVSVTCGPNCTLIIAGSEIQVNQLLRDITQLLDKLKSKKQDECHPMEHSLNKQLIISMKYKNKNLKIRHPSIPFKRILNYPFAVKEILLNWLSKPAMISSEEASIEDSVVIIEPENSIVVIDEESVIFIDGEEGNRNDKVINFEDPYLSNSKAHIIDLTSEEDSISDPETLINSQNKVKNNHNDSDLVICLTPSQNINQNKTRKRKKCTDSNPRNGKTMKMTSLSSNLVITLTPDENVSTCPTKNANNPEPKVLFTDKAPLPQRRCMNTRLTSIPSNSLGKRISDKTMSGPAVVGYNWESTHVSPTKEVEILENTAQSTFPSKTKACPLLSSVFKSTLRPIVIDGSNVARAHGQALGEFSCKGIELCIQYFLNRGHKEITAFVPLYMTRKKTPIPVKDQHILTKSELKNYIAFTPSRFVDKTLISSYDDRYIVELATKNGGVIVSNDNFRDLMQEKPEWKKTIKERLLMFCMVGDYFMPPEDPLGRNGPNLSQFLKFPS